LPFPASSRYAAGMGIETYRGIVYPWHCDVNGHMNVMWYAGKFDEATWSLFASVGLNAAYIRGGHGMFAVEQNIQYRKELLAGDLVVVRSRMLEARDKSLRFEHEMRHADRDEVAATAQLTGVHVDMATRKATPLPPAIRANIQRSIEAG
jgi:acyl-CoA thioester hydrolase